MTQEGHPPDRNLSTTTNFRRQHLTWKIPVCSQRLWDWKEIFTESSDSNLLQHRCQKWDSCWAWHDPLADFWERPLFQKMMKVSNQDLRIMLGNSVELNIRPSPKFPALVVLPHFAPAKLLLVGEDPGCICRDAITFSVTWSYEVTGYGPSLSFPCSGFITTQRLWSWCLLGHLLGWVLYRNLLWAGAMASASDGKRGHLEKRPERACGFFIDGTGGWRHESQGELALTPLWLPWGRWTTCLALVPWGLEGQQKLCDMKPEAAGRHRMW